MKTLTLLLIVLWASPASAQVDRASAVHFDDLSTAPTHENLDRVRKALDGMPRDTTALSRLIDEGVTRPLTDEERAALAATLVEEAKKETSRTPETVFAIASAADWVHTGIVMAHGWKEANPAYGWIPNNAAVIATGAASDVLGAWAWKKLTKNHKKIQAVGFYIAAAHRGLIIFRTIRTARKPRALAATWSQNSFLN